MRRDATRAYQLSEGAGAHLPFPGAPDGRVATHYAEGELVLLAAVHTRACNKCV